MNMKIIRANVNKNNEGFVNRALRSKGNTRLLFFSILITLYPVVTLVEHGCLTMGLLAEMTAYVVLPTVHVAEDH